MFPRRLPWKSKAHFPVLVVYDQIVSFRRELKITVDPFWHEQLFALGAFFDLFIYRSHFLAHQRLILCKRHPALLELPLTFEQRGLVYERKHIIERDVVDDTRAEEWRSRSRHIAAHCGTLSVRRISCAPRARLRGFANTEFLFFTDQIFDIVSSLGTQSRPGFLRLLLPVGVSDQLVHRVQPGKRITCVVQLAVIKRLQIVLDVTTRQRRATETTGTLMPRSFISSRFSR